MMRLLNIALILCVVFFVKIAVGQKVSVVSAQERVEGELRKGMETLVVLEAKKVEAEWQKYLKQFGKVLSKKGGVYLLESAEIKDISGTPVMVYSWVYPTNTGVRVFWSLFLGNEYITPETNEHRYNAAAKILRDFGVKMYIDDINEQISDAEKALNTTVKNQEKKIKEGSQIERKIENNKKEKKDLEEKLRNNAQEAINLENSKKQNKLDQEAASKDVEKMKAALERVKAKLSKVE
ncbi:MAG: hypothetical protein SNJ77_01540 [Cytophagales bacterium]